MSQLLTAGRLARLTLLAAITAALLLVPLSPAQARPAAVDASAAGARAAGVPNCVTTSLNDDGALDYLTVRNRCGSTQRIKVVIAHNPDFACRTYRPGTTGSYRWGWPGRFDGLKSC